MANRYWVGAVDGTWNDAGNWSASSGGAGGAGIPGSGDIAIFDGSYTGTAACTCDVAINVLGIDVQATYDAKLDFADSAFAHSVGTSGMTYAGGNPCEIDCGDSTITCDGDFNNKDQWIWTDGTSEIVMTGTSSITSKSNLVIHDLTFNAGAVVTIHADTSGWLTVANVCTVSGDLILAKRLQVNRGGDLVLNETGTITRIAGEDIFFDAVSSGHGIVTYHPNATLDVEINFLKPEPGSIFAPGVYDGPVIVTANNVSLLTLSSTAVTEYTFNGGLELEQTGTGTTTLDTKTNAVTINVTDLTIDIDNVGGTVVIDNAGAAVDWNISGNVIDEIDGGTLTWNPGVGTVTFDGTTNYDGAEFGNLGDVTVAANADLAFASNMEADDFIGSQGCTVTEAAGGPYVLTCDSFNLNGINGNGITWTDVDVTTTAAGTAAWTTVTNSDAVPGADIDATDNCTNGGGNDAGWNFGVVAFGGLSQIIGGGMVA